MEKTPPINKGNQIGKDHSPTREYNHTALSNHSITSVEWLQRRFLNSEELGYSNMKSTIQIPTTKKESFNPLLGGGSVFVDKGVELNQIVELN